jgi:zinc-ribbon domain
MFCPKCGHQQLSDQQRFCSRCGFPLSGVADLIDRGGILPPLENESNEQDYSPRRQGIKQGIVLMMFAVILVTMVGVIAPPYHEALVFAFLIGGLMRAIYAVLFQEGASKQPTEPLRHQESSPITSELNAREAGAALAPASSTPVIDFGSERKERTTVVEPPSVTENTTKLLEDR